MKDKKKIKPPIVNMKLFKDSNGKTMTDTNNKYDFSDIQYFNETHNNRSGGKPYITITKGDRISFNGAFLRLHADILKDKTHIKIGYSAKSSAICIKFITANELDNTFVPIKITNGSKNYSISCSARLFLKKTFMGSEHYYNRYESSPEDILGIGQCFIIKICQEI